MISKYTKALLPLTMSHKDAFAHANISLTGIHFTSEFTEASDKYSLVRLTHRDGKSYDPVDVVLPVQFVKDALKMIPTAKGASDELKFATVSDATSADRAMIYSGAPEGEDGWHIVGATIEDPYPSVDRAFPEGEPVASVRMDPKKLMVMAKSAMDAGVEKLDIEIREPGDFLRPVVFLGENDLGQKFSGLVMPIIDTH